MISIDGIKTFDKIQHFFMIKTLNRLGIEVNFLNLIKVSTENSQLTLCLKVEH